MLIVEKIVGNTGEDPELARLSQEWRAAGCVERLMVDVWEAQKSRLRKQTDLGTEIGVNLDRGRMLRHGDVLFLDGNSRRVILVELKSRQVLIIRLLPQPTMEEAAQVALKLGHILGNQHWPVKLDGLTAYVPVVIDQKVMETVLRTHGLKGIEWRFQEADPTMELPLVFPSLEDHVHTHPHQHGLPNSHGRGHEQGHDHDHAHPHGHAHGHD